MAVVRSVTVMVGRIAVVVLASMLIWHAAIPWLGAGVAGWRVVTGTPWELESAIEADFDAVRADLARRVPTGARVYVAQDDGPLWYQRLVEFVVANGDYLVARPDLADVYVWVVVDPSGNPFHHLLMVSRIR